MPRALVVDDDVFLNILYSLYLRDFFACDTATDGDEAVRLFAQALGQDRPYDLVFTDIHMPGLDGIEALRAMRRLEAGSGRAARAVLVSSDDGRREIMARCAGLAVDALLLKPCLREAVDGVIAQLGLDQGQEPSLWAALTRDSGPRAAFPSTIRTLPSPG
jgi:CheY-like chemotaxis protein